MNADNNKDDIYLNHLSNIMTSQAASRLQYLGFLIPINLAIYAGIHALNQHDLWALNGQKLFITLMLIFINLCFTRMYLREHNLIDIRDETFCAQVNGEAYRGFKAQLDQKDKMRGIEWQTVKIILSGINAVPIVFLVGLLITNLPKRFEFFGLGILEIASGIALIVGGRIIYLLLEHNEHHRTDTESQRL